MVVTRSMARVSGDTPSPQRLGTPQRLPTPRRSTRSKKTTSISKLGASTPDFAPDSPPSTPLQEQHDVEAPNEYLDSHYSLEADPQVSPSIPSPTIPEDPQEEQVSTDEPLEILEAELNTTETEVSAEQIQVEEIQVQDAQVEDIEQQPIQIQEIEQPVSEVHPEASPCVEQTPNETPVQSHSSSSSCQCSVICGVASKLFFLFGVVLTFIVTSLLVLLFISPKLPTLIETIPQLKILLEFSQFIEPGFTSIFETLQQAYVSKNPKLIVDFIKQSFSINLIEQTVKNVSVQIVFGGYIGILFILYVLLFKIRRNIPVSLYSKQAQNLIEKAHKGITSSDLQSELIELLPLHKRRILKSWYHVENLLRRVESLSIRRNDDGEDKWYYNC
ncbi:hypothetical protein RCL1_008621 [Eukaryota sp. TZLM3-RCL]